MTPLDWAKRPLYKYADLTGRASRPEYWWFILAIVIAGVAGGFIDGMLGLNTRLLGGFGPLSAIVILGLTIPSLTAGVRRLHDSGRSGWWMLLACIPLANLGVLYLLTLEGTPGPNEFGPQPEANPGLLASL